MPTRKHFQPWFTNTSVTNVANDGTETFMNGESRQGITGASSQELPWVTVWLQVTISARVVKTWSHKSPFTWSSFTNLGICKVNLLRAKGKIYSMIKYKVVIFIHHHSFCQFSHFHYAVKSLMTDFQLSLLCQIIKLTEHKGRGNIYIAWSGY